MLEGMYILLCKCPLVARSSFRLSVCRGSGGGSSRRSNGRKDGGDNREG
jgi:hypothetical protein